MQNSYTFHSSSGRPLEQTYLGQMDSSASTQTVIREPPFFFHCSCSQNVELLAFAPRSPSSHLGTTRIGGGGVHLASKRLQESRKLRQVPKGSKKLREGPRGSEKLTTIPAHTAEFRPAEREALRWRPILAKHFLEASKRGAAKQNYRRRARR